MCVCVCTYLYIRVFLTKIEIVFIELQSEVMVVEVKGGERGMGVWWWRNESEETNGRNCAQ